MKLLSLVLPGTAGPVRIDNTPPTVFNADPTLGHIVSDAYLLGLYAAGFMMFIWVAWGIFQYIISEGNKEGLAKARARIRWAMIGFVIFIISLFASQYAETIFPGVLKFAQVDPTPVLLNGSRRGNQSIGSNFAFGDIQTLGDAIAYLVPVAFSIATVLVSFYFLLGAFEMVYSNGDKNATAAARSKITHAIIGFLLLILMFLIFQYLPSALGLVGFKIIGP